MKTSINLGSIQKTLRKVLRSVNLYRTFIFFLLVAGLYGFIVWRINVLATAEPTDSQRQTAQESVKSPKIDAATVRKMQSLKDNSVNVQTLFEQARNNPFSE